MRCIDTNELQEYLDNYLQPLEKLVVEEHLESCEKCRSELVALQLLFWQLADIKNQALDIPPEMAKVRESTLNKLLISNQEVMDAAKIYKLHKNNLTNASSWVKFVPGVRAGESYLKKGINKAPSAAFAISRFCVRGGLKLLQARLPL
jgi:hypothetical protein